MLQIAISLFLALIHMGAVADATSTVEAVLARYRQAPAIQAKLKKTVEQELIGSRSESEGEFFFSQGKMRMNFHQPEASILVYDGKDIWHESRLDDQVQVSRFKAGELKKTDSLLAALFDRKAVLKSAFKLVKQDDGLFEFKPKDTKKTEVRWLGITIKGPEIQRISYKDDRENQVTFEFDKITRGPVPKGTFQYKPPKGAQVTRF